MDYRGWGYLDAGWARWVKPLPNCTYVLVPYMLSRWYIVEIDSFSNRRSCLFSYLDRDEAVLLMYQLQWGKQ